MKTNQMKPFCIILSLPFLALFSCQTSPTGNEPPKQDTAQQALHATPPASLDPKEIARQALDSLQAQLPPTTENLPALLPGNNPYTADAKRAGAAPEAAWIDAAPLGDSLLVATMTYNGGQTCVHRFLVVLNKYTLKSIDNKLVESNCEDQTEEEGPLLSYGFTNDSTFYTEAVIRGKKTSTGEPALKRDTWRIATSGRITPAP